jgi:hypothetical protein
LRPEPVIFPKRVLFGKDPQRAWRAPPGMKMFSGFARVPGRTHSGAAIA